MQICRVLQPSLQYLSSPLKKSVAALLPRFSWGGFCFFFFNRRGKGAWAEFFSLILKPNTSRRTNVFFQQIFF